MHQICWFVISSIFCDCGRVNAWPGPSPAKYPEWALGLHHRSVPAPCQLFTDHSLCPGPASPVSSSPLTTRSERRTDHYSAFEETCKLGGSLKEQERKKHSELIKFRKR